MRIAGLYDALADLTANPVVEVSRAVAHGRAFGAEAGLAALERLGDEPLPESHLVPAVRADLLARAGRPAEAAAAFREAAARTRNDGERALAHLQGHRVARASPAEVSSTPSRFRRRYQVAGGRHAVRAE